MQTKTAHHDPWHRRFSAPQVALTRPRLLRFALHFTILSLNIMLIITLKPNKGVEEDREDPVLINDQTICLSQKNPKPCFSVLLLCTVGLCRYSVWPLAIVTTAASVEKETMINGTLPRMAQHHSPHHVDNVEVDLSMRTRERVASAMQFSSRWFY